MADKKQLEKEAKEIFNSVDKDKSGFIEAKEIESALRTYNETAKPKMDEASIKKEAATFVEKVDKNKDGKVSFQEFFELILEIFGN